MQVSQLLAEVIVFNVFYFVTFYVFVVFTARCAIVHSAVLP